jgi:hypothetical protein
MIDGFVLNCPPPPARQTAGVQVILASVIQALRDNPDRRFIYAEMVGPLCPTPPRAPTPSSRSRRQPGLNRCHTHLAHGPHRAVVLHQVVGQAERRHQGAGAEDGEGWAAGLCERRLRAERRGGLPLRGHDRPGHARAQVWPLAWCCGAARASAAPGGLQQPGDEGGRGAPAAAAAALRRGRAARCPAARLDPAARSCPCAGSSTPRSARCPRWAGSWTPLATHPPRPRSCRRWWASRPCSSGAPTTRWALGAGHWALGTGRWALGWAGSWPGWYRAGPSAAGACGRPCAQLLPSPPPPPLQGWLLAIRGSATHGPLSPPPHPPPHPTPLAGHEPAAGAQGV